MDRTYPLFRTVQVQTQTQEPRTVQVQVQEQTQEQRTVPAQAEAQVTDEKDPLSTYITTCDITDFLGHEFDAVEVQAIERECSRRHGFSWGLKWAQRGVMMRLTSITAKETR